MGDVFLECEKLLNDTLCPMYKVIDGRLKIYLNQCTTNSKEGKLEKKGRFVEYTHLCGGGVIGY